uniref:NTP pyrophosphohydrolase MazG-like domain-containing protein n=1 Tax=uncultured Bacillota bacterium TaxID=344338 RepID=A0A650F4Q0_9FIRM|nr:hypothetical protein Firmicute1046_1710 [uncultured Firmicutes bacterium]
MKNEKYDFQDLVEIIEKLRAPGGCPWDREQTHESIKKNLIEEGYELIEALESGDGAKMADESGDLLLQIVFHANIGKEAGKYDILDVTDAVCRKMIHRHPHVFGDVKADTSEEVLRNWDAIKRDDREQKTIAEDLAGISSSLPSLMRTEKVQKKAEKNGYLFGNPEDAADGVARMLKAIANGADSKTAEMYIGKVLFDVVSAARAVGVEPELALSKETDGFIEEFAKFEQERK